MEDKATIIISALNEEYLQPTLDTLFERTPEKLLDKVIVIDDQSEEPIKIDHPKVHIIRNEIRQGLIRSRDIASKLAQSTTVISIDAHIKVAKNWLPPILDRLSANYKCIGVPLTRGLDPKEWKTTGPASAKTAWRWNLDFHWAKDDKSNETPAFAGHCFAFTKKWWQESGGFDTGMEKWGGENIEFSLRTWLCGGSVEIIRDSRTSPDQRDRPYASWNSAEPPGLRRRS